MNQTIVYFVKPGDGWITAWFRNTGDMDFALMRESEWATMKRCLQEMATIVVDADEVMRLFDSDEA